MWVPLGVAACLLAAVVAVTRVLTGVHYPSDVLAGLAFGAGAAAVSYTHLDRFGGVRGQPGVGGKVKPGPVHLAAAGVLCANHSAFPAHAVSQGSHCLLYTSRCV